MLGQLAREEIANNRRDLGSLTFQGEVPGIEQVQFRVWIVAPESFSSGGDEEWIVLAPYGEQRGPVRADVLLEFRIECYQRYEFGLKPPV